MISVESPEQLSELIGQEILSTKTIAVTQALIDEFCAISGDHQWIHTSTSKSPIVPGNLLIALLPQLVQSCIHVETFTKCITARYDSIKFRKPVVAGDRVGLRVAISSVKTKSDKTYCELHCKLIKDDSIVVEGKVTDIYYR